ncbi:MAG: amino acid adenylation domain-containing protein, partial [bacterium]|nr:amino acid adenylation domain-containing protein [bacterium]
YHTPSAHAVTYRELNERSNHLAHQLISRGVKPGTIVTIKSERSVEMIIGLLGILKAGGAYLPIDPGYPVERIKYMLKDSNTKILLTGVKELNEIKAWGEGIEIVDINTIYQNIHPTESQYPLTDNPSPSFPDNQYPITNNQPLAYIIYTSGSTGKPKGVMIQHPAFVNFIKGMTDIIEFKPEDTILSLTTICFDIFGLETLLPLTTGTKIVIGSRTQQMEPYAAGQIMEQEHVSLFQATPSRLQLLLSDEKSRAGLARLNHLLLGGETLPLILLEEARKIIPGTIYNVYGPTETTIWSTAKDVTGENALNIGKPIANTQIYILDRCGNLQPKGIAGELCIGGDGLARGYINNPEMTSEKFVKASRQLAV